MNNPAPPQAYNEDQLLLASTFMLDFFRRKWFDGLFQDKDSNHYIPRLMLGVYLWNTQQCFLTIGQATQFMGTKHGRTSNRYLGITEKMGLITREPGTPGIDGRRIFIKPTQKLIELCERELDQMEVETKGFMTDLLLAGPLPDTGAAKFKIRARPEQIPALEARRRRILDRGYLRRGQKLSP